MSDDLGTSINCRVPMCEGHNARTGRQRLGDELTGLGGSDGERFVLAEIKCDTCGHAKWIEDGTVVEKAR